MSLSDIAVLVLLALVVALFILGRSRLNTIRKLERQNTFLEEKNKEISNLIYDLEKERALNSVRTLPRYGI